MQVYVYIKTKKFTHIWSEAENKTTKNKIRLTEVVND